MIDSTQNLRFPNVAYRLGFRAIESLMSLAGAKVWCRNSIALGYSTPWVSDMDLTLFAPEPTPLRLFFIQILLKASRAVFPLLGEHHVFDSQHAQIYKKYCNRYELERDPVLAGAGAKPGDDPSSRAAFAVRALAADWKNLKTRPACRRSKWAHHLKTLSVDETIDGFGRESLVSLLKKSFFSGITALPLESAIALKTPRSTPLDDEVYLSLLLVNPSEWLARRGYLQRRSSHLFKLIDGLDVKERQLLREQLRWEIAGLCSQHLGSFRKAKWVGHIGRVVGLFRYFFPEDLKEVLSDLETLGCKFDLDTRTLSPTREISPTFCPVPFRYLDHRADGSSTVCRDLKADNKQSPEEIRTSLLRGQTPAACRGCGEMEAVCASSPRTAAIQLHAAHNFEIGSPHYRADTLRLGFEISPLLDSTSLAEIRTVLLRDGDALLAAGHPELLARLLSTGNARQMGLVYQTHFTRVPSQWFESWKRFHSVTFEVLLRGVGRRFDFASHPRTWSALEGHLEQIQGASSRFKAVFNFEVSMLNIWHANDLIDWIVKSPARRARIDSGNWKLLFSAPIEPEVLSLRKIPDGPRAAAARALRETLDKYPENLTTGLCEVLPILERKSSGLAPSDAAEIRGMIQWSEQINGESFSEHFPELAQIILDSGR